MERIVANNPEAVFVKAVICDGRPIPLDNILEVWPRLAYVVTLQSDRDHGVQVVTQYETVEIEWYPNPYGYGNGQTESEEA